jgi:hypothetical protein
MLLGDIKAAYTVIGSLRMDMADQWDRRQTEAQIQELAGTYDHPDVLWICCVVARDPNNRAPVMLQKLAPRIYEKLHAKVASNPTPGPRKTEGGFLCDICTKPEGQCQSAVTNLNGIDHAYVSAKRAQDERDRIDPGGRKAAARKQAFERAGRRVFESVTDVTDQKPQPQIQEEEAS